MDATLQPFQDLERAAAPRDLQNWRFQQALYRAYYDAYVRQRLIAERALEAEAMAQLASARDAGARAALDAAAATLARPSTTPTLLALRARVGELAEALFQSIHMQLAVKPYGAIAVGRGATLDTIDMPLNDRAWLADRFTEIRGIGERRRAAGRHRPDPGTGPIRGPAASTTTSATRCVSRTWCAARAWQPIPARFDPPRSASAIAPAGDCRG